jgi:predicted nuclease with TOPRIM domain
METKDEIKATREEAKRIREETKRLREEHKALKKAYEKLRVHHKCSEKVLEVADEMFGFDLQKKYEQELAAQLKKEQTQGE